MEVKDFSKKELETYALEYEKRKELAAKSLERACDIFGYSSVIDLLAELRKEGKV